MVSIAENAAYEATLRDLTGEQAACLSLWRPGPGNISLTTSGACASLRGTCWRGLASNGLGTSPRKGTAHTVGWRPSEILGLRVVDVNIAEQTIRIETSKNDDEPGECPLPRTDAVMRRRLVAGRGADELVSPFNADEWRYVWQQIKKSAAAPKWSFTICGAHLRVTSTWRASTRVSLCPCKIGSQARFRHYPQSDRGRSVRRTTQDGREHAHTTHQTASRSRATVNKSGDCITGA